MTYNAAKTALKAIDMKLEKTEFGEFRVNFFRDDREATAYYTDDVMDAYQTGVQMMRASREIEFCPKCGKPVTRGNAYADAGTGPETGRMFFYCSEHCREIH